MMPEPEPEASLGGDTSTPLAARDHARAMAGTRVRAMPTIPASAATDLPAGVRAADVVWDETLGPGDYASRVLVRGTRLRLTNLEGDGCIGCLVYNADQPIERLNVPDTIKVQWNAYLSRGKLLLSDMGRALMSILEDTSGRHDVFCGCSNEAVNARKYGSGTNHGAHPNARDRFLVGLAKHGLGRKDIVANVNLFKEVRVGEDGRTTLLAGPGSPGEYVELRAEMNVLVVLANTPHVLDDRTTYTATPVRALAWRGAPAGGDDWARNASPESLRAFQNVDDYFAR
jgi:urea carboxylase-associated protein 2